MMYSTAAPKVQSRSVLAFAVAGVLLSATGRPVEKTLATIVSMGATDGVGRALLHAAPVILFVGAIIIGRAVGHGRSKATRLTLFALLGGIAGFVTAFCLDLFAAVPEMIEAVNGPLTKPSVIDIGLWTLGALSISLALMVAAIAIFGGTAISALQVEPDIDPEMLDVRKSERRLYSLSGIGMLFLGIACLALAIARQSGEGARLGPAILAVTAGVIAIILNYLLWRNLDELQRRQALNGYAASAVVATLAAFGWSVASAAGFAPGLDAGGAFLMLVAVQIVVTTYAAAGAMAITGRTLRG